MSSPLPDISKTDLEIINCLNHNGFNMKKYLHLHKKTNSSPKGEAEFKLGYIKKRT